MSIRWKHLAVAAGGGIISYLVGSVGFWAQLTTPLLSVLSILAAAIFVRLARGVAAGSTDAITVDSARKISAAMKKAVRALRALLLVIVTTMVIVIFAQNIYMAWAHVFPNSISGMMIFGKSLSAIIGFLLAFVLVRIVAVIQSDVDITDLQASNLILSASKKQGDEAEKMTASATHIASTATGGYGKIYQ